MTEFTHLDAEGRVRMVDVTEKAPTARTAVASAEVPMRPDTFELNRDHKVKKGNVLDIGIIHRFMSIERQAHEVRRVKRSESYVVENPVTIFSHETISSARKKMVDENVGGLVVVENGGILVGLLTSRDILLAPDENAVVASAMTPRDHLVVASSEAGVEPAKVALHQHRIEKLPLVDNQNRVVGLITASDIVKLQQHPNATKDSKGRLRVGVAIGTHPEDNDRVAACLQEGADVIVALETLVALKGNGRAIAVVGDMLELGALSEEAHLRLGKKIGELSIDLLIALGQYGSRVVESAVRQGLHRGQARAVQTHSEALAVLNQILHPGDSVLVKGSRGMAMEEIAENLKAGRA